MLSELFDKLMLHQIYLNQTMLSGTIPVIDGTFPALAFGNGWGNIRSVA